MVHHDSPPPAGRPLDADAPERRPLPAMTARLLARRSVPLRGFCEEAIPEADLQTILTIAARTPDHGRLVPWRFIVVEGAARRLAGARLDALYGRRNPDLAETKRDMWTLYMLRAPVVVILVSRPDPSAKVPVLDQMLSAGAAGMNLTAGAISLGYAVQWLLKWPGRDAEAAALFGVEAGEQVAGFLHLGRQNEATADRPRPALADIVTRWSA